MEIFRITVWVINFTVVYTVLSPQSQVM